MMLNKLFAGEQKFTYLDSPAGMLTPKGYLFGTREAELKTYAPELLEQAPAGEWLRKASRWIESTDAIGVWVSLILLALLPPTWAVPVALGLIVLWHRSRSALAGPAADAPLGVLSNEIVLFLAGVAFLSWFGISGEAGKVAYGLLLFLTSKFGWNRLLLNRIFEGDVYGNANPAAELPKAGSNDRILNMLLVRFALKQGVTLASVETMERDLMQAMEKSAVQRKKWAFRSKK
ncbi:MAG: hypothetical protein LAT75_03630 [Candidatus Cyclonatronum sp.]|uniref:hypothetical protein n=1 Tax=Cyclonatronum sp. TaxID=3024185 RepID=UPI0025C15028|nr:hypothetical protein [Cyclonatronum sp.]MCC5933628.1 hypothetical protein [Balneolales bacterium]MCH8485928.1 hypothetical protein [Cyclonatronum sp.]